MISSTLTPERNATETILLTAAVFALHIPPLLLSMNVSTKLPSSSQFTVIYKVPQALWRQYVLPCVVPRRLREIGVI